MKKHKITFASLLIPGMKMGRLTVLDGGDPAVSAAHRMVKLRCSCGEKIERKHNLLTVKYKPIRSCGCLRVDAARTNARKQVKSKRGRFTAMIRWDVE